MQQIKKPSVCFLFQNMCETQKKIELTGVVVSLKSDFGFIRSDSALPEPFVNKEVFFRFNDVRNNVSVCVNNNVKFELNKHRPEKPRARNVIVVDSSGAAANGNASEQNVEQTDLKFIRGVKYTGVVDLVKEHFGFIQLNDELPEPFTCRRIYFSIKCVRNHSAVQVGDTVRCEIHDKSEIHKPKAKSVWVENLDSDNRKQEQNAEKDQNEQQKEELVDTKKDKRTTVIKDSYYGEIVTILENKSNKKGGFIKPSEELPSPYPEDRDVYFHLNTVQSGMLELEVGDMVEFVLGTKDKERPFAYRVKLVECKTRSTESIENYLQHLLNEIQSKVEDSTQNISAILSCSTVWKVIGEAVGLSASGIQMLINLIDQLEKHCYGLEEKFKEAMAELTSTSMFNPWKGWLKNFIQDMLVNDCPVTLMKIEKFLLLMMQYVPAKTRAIVGIIKPVVTGNPKEMFLYDVLKQLCKSSNEICVEDMEWNELPLVPSQHEMLYSNLSTNINLYPVKKEGRYSSVEEYLDVYFRLLRADCFNALTLGIKKLLAGKLDQRDMHVYQNIELVGIVITQTESGIALAIKATPQQEVKSWDTASNLIFGNLLCISPSGNFRDVIWATVVSRSLLKDKGLVLVDLCTESNAMSDPEAVRMIEASSGHGLMVESPAYYKAYHPVLKALQQIESQQMPFVEELVEVKKSSAPASVNLFSRILPSIIYEGMSDSHITVHELLNSNVETCKLDSSQEIAVKQALQHRVAMIQGPPGTGKTFIGTMLVELLLSVIPPTQAQAVKLPVLVLTYKNHVLDEFLMRLLKLFPGKVARIGGRSQEPGLEGCNLNQLKRQKLKAMPQTLLNDIQQYQAKIDEMKPAVESAFKKLEKEKTLSLEILRKNLSNTQIQRLLVGCDWNKASIPLYNFNDSGGAKKKRKIKFLCTEEALELLDTLEMDAEKFISVRAEDKRCKYVNEMVVTALKQWMPSKEDFDELSQEINSDVRLGKKHKDVIDYIDEKDTLEVEEERLTAYASDFESKEDILKNIIMLKADSSSSEWFPTLLSSAKNLMEDLPLGFLTNVENLWQLPTKQRVIYIQAILYRLFEGNSKEIIDLLQDYQRFCRLKNEIENQHKVHILKDMMVIGMTITGASIQHDLLSQIKPGTILVEEAAEVLEPQLIAAMGNWCEHLILIGDHKQLRPPVESIDLVKQYSFDVSMMERLITNGLDFATLSLQNRMRPEFAEMLVDIYPNLRSNYSRVSRNTPPPCVSSSMFFWNHSSHDEKHHHTFTNEEEAIRAVKLALFFIQQGHEPRKITILGAYLRQVRLIRVLMTKAVQDHSEIMDLHKKEKDQGKASEVNKVKIQSIDNYQGDENDIVIVSLVRCNSNNNIGFLKLENRRCVAQSRARCGMYFIGNKSTFSESTTWAHVLDFMSERDLIGDALELKCPKHDLYSRFTAKCADDISFGTFCHMNCGEIMDCKKHLCKKMCQPNHKHMQCQEEVPFVFGACGHHGKRKCFQKESDVLCQMLVQYKFGSCGHTCTKLCYQKSEELKCLEKCTKTLPCHHLCGNRCWEPCSPDTCDICKVLREIEEKKRRKEEEAKRKKIIQEVSEEIEKLKRTPLEWDVSEIKPEGVTASEYYDIEDKVKKYIKPGHKWFPFVTKIEKVYNSKLKMKWMKRKKDMFDPSYIPMKFHGTSKDAVYSIVKEGFRMPKPNKQMYGAGIYFATDSSKSAQEIYTKGSNTLLLCSVLIGKYLTVEKAMPLADENSLSARGYDSLYAARDTKDTGGVLYDEYVVYHPDAALVEYIIHFETMFQDSLSTMMEALELDALKSSRIVRYEIVPKREIKRDDALDSHFRIAESQFLRLNQSSNYKITKVEYHLNPRIMTKFYKKLEKFKEKYQASAPNLASMIYAFHGTKCDAVDSIIKNNFDLNKLSKSSGDKGFYGAGIYFSDFPNISLQYGSSLLLCKVLPGKTYNVPGLMMGTNLKPGYDSHRYHETDGGYGKELVIFDPDQIWPCYVVRYEKK